MRIVINSVSSRMGGAATYLRQLARHLGESPREAQYVLIVPENAQAECAELVKGNAVVLASRWANRGIIHHVLWEQVWLRCFLLCHGADLLVNTSAYGLIFPPCPQTILLRNPVVFSRRYPMDLRRAGRGRQVIEVRLRREMMRISGLFSAKVFVPTDSMGRRVRRWLPRLEPKLRTSWYGVELPPAGGDGGATSWRKELDDRAPDDALLILYVSHYAWHKNFDTLIAAIPAIQRAVKRPVRVVLTARIGEGVVWCGCDTSSTARKMHALNVDDAVIRLGAVPHDEIADLYSRCDLFVFPSHCESFGQPLAEAMAVGLPIVASDEAVCRELCGDAARYFRTFDASDLARFAAEVLTNPSLASSLTRHGKTRAAQLSWPRHFRDLLGGAEGSTVPERERPPLAKPCGVSVLLITWNEAPNIRRCLRGLRWADEVFVVDSFSTDATAEICREFAGGNVRFVQHRFSDFASQRNWGLDHLPWSNEWVFVLDADEVVSPALAREVVQAVRSDDGRCAGLLGRDRHVFLGRPIRNATRCIVRLFRRDLGRYVHPVNEKLAIKGRLGALSNRITHETRKDLADWVAKNNRYSSLEAVEYARSRRRPLWECGTGELLSRPDLRRMALKALFVRMPFRPVWIFLYMCLWRGGVLDGVAGLIYSVLMAWVSFQISVKMLEMDPRWKAQRSCV